MSVALFIMDAEQLARLDGSSHHSLVPRIAELWDASPMSVALGWSGASGELLPEPRSTASVLLLGRADASAHEEGLIFLRSRGASVVFLTGWFDTLALDTLLGCSARLGLQLKVVKDCCAFASPDELRGAYAAGGSGAVLQSVEALTRLSPLTTSTKFEGRYLRVYNRAGWEFVERTRGKEVVVLVPLIERDLLFVEQYRAPLDRMVIELPAGLVGDDLDRHDESLEDAARRELLEETGFEAERLEWLTSGPCSAGLSNEVIHLFLAAGLVQRTAGGGDSLEQIQTHRIAVADAETWLMARLQSGDCLIDPKVYIGLYFLGRALPDGAGA